MTDERLAEIEARAIYNSATAETLELTTALREAQARASELGARLVPFSRFAQATLALRDALPDDRIEMRCGEAVLTIGDLRRLAATVP